MATGWQEAVITQSVRLEAYTPELVEMTPPPPRTLVKEKHYRIAMMERFTSCNLEPYIYFAVRPERMIKGGKSKSAQVQIFVIPLTHPKRPGLYLDEKPAKIEVKIERPGTRFPMIARLGVAQDMNDFRELQNLLLPNYTAGEEQNWKLTIIFQRFSFKE